MEQTNATIAGIRERLARYGKPGVPKYIALRDVIVASVTAGEWPGGTRLPTESEWAVDLPLSLGTIQRALRILADEGVVVRRPGRGTFVVERQGGEMHAPLHCRFVDDAGTGYLPVFSKVVARCEVDSEGRWSRHLGTSRLVRIDRVLSINDEFRVFSRFYADPLRMPAFARLPLRKLSGENFKEIIWRESQQPIARISQHLSTLAFPPDVAKATRTRRGSPGQQLEVCAFIGGDSPIYYQDLYIAPNSRRLHLAGD